jgi:hypothetical protein
MKNIYNQIMQKIAKNIFSEVANAGNGIDEECVNVQFSEHQRRAEGTLNNKRR